MSLATVHATVGPDGVLTLAVPLGAEYAGREVIVHVERVLPRLSREDWLKFLNETAGSIQDPTFFRHPQCEHEALPERTSEPGASASEPRA